ncbi:MAG: PEGA domain-containing protein [Methanomicrobiaceae archaeon]|nr:PEGA domain-containing protein [Methanomicrobiaceae archaeon]
MKALLRIIPLLLLCSLVFLTGCTFLEEPETVTPTPSAPGSLIVTSNPWNARVFLDGEYHGRAPTTIGNVAPGPHELIVTMEDYSDWTKIVDVTSGQSTTVKASLSIAQPKIELSIESAQSGFSTPRCYWEIRGTVSNTGDFVARQITLEATIDPKSSDYKETKKLISFGSLSPGESKTYLIKIEDTPCVESTGKVKCEYIDAEDDEKSVSKSI